MKSLRLTVPNILIACLVLVPMPIAGGVPYLIGITFVLLFISIRKQVGKQRQKADKERILLYLSVLLLVFEAISAIFHNTDRDINLLFARGLWVLLGYGYLVSVLGSGEARDVYQNTRTILILACTLMLVSMFMESMFYPNRYLGRSIGSFTLPWPRATGVPQSDGKIGVFVSLSLIFFLVSYWVRRDRQSFLFIAVCIGILSFTQSRSTFLAFVIVFWCFVWYLIASGKKSIPVLLVSFVTLTVGLLAILNLDLISNVIRGEGIYAKNFDSRFIQMRIAIDRLAESPLVGLGANYIVIEGFVKEVGIHNTFLGLFVKSGIISSVLFTGFLLFSATAVLKTNDIIFGKIALYVAVLAGPVVEHSLYPGYFNEHLWMIYPVGISIAFLARKETRNAHGRNREKIVDRERNFRKHESW